MKTSYGYIGADGFSRNRGPGGNRPAGGGGRGRAARNKGRGGITDCP